MKKHSIKDILINGGSIEFKKLCICYLPHYYNGIVRRKQYQVHCEHRKLENNVYSILYDDLDEAIDKFLGLKTFVYG